MAEAAVDDIEALYELLSLYSEPATDGAPIDDIEDWSKTQAPWRQDCLRRLALSDGLTQADLDELVAIIKASADCPSPRFPPNRCPSLRHTFPGASRSRSR